MKKKLPIISFVAAIVTMLIGILVIIGWFTHNDFLRMLVPGQVKMKFNVASGFALSSIVLFLNYSSRKNKIQHRISVLLSIVVSLTGLLTLIEYVFNLDLDIDELFVKDELRTTAVYYAGRMSPLAAINFLLIGTGLLLLNKEKTATYQFYYLFGIVFIALLMLIGFNFISDIPTYIRLAIHVALGFITLPAAIWFAQPMLQKKISFERKLFTGFFAVIILMVALGIFSSYYSNRRISTAHLVEHTKNVLSEAEQTLSLVKDIESGGRGYILTGDSNYLEYFTIAKNNIPGHINRLKELTNNNPSQHARIDSLSALVDKRIAFSMLRIQLRNEKGVEAANKLMTTRLGKFYTDKIRNVISAIQQEENDLHIQQQKENYKSIVSFNRAFFVFLAGVLILLVIIPFSIRNNIITRKKAAENLKKSEKNFQLLVSNVKDYAIFLLDKDGRIASWNSGAEHIKGYTAKEIIGKPLDIFYTAEEKERGEPKRNLKMALEHGHFETEGLRVRKDGSTFYANIVFTSVIDENGKLVGYAKVTKDITEKKKTEERILFLATIANNIQDPVIASDNNFCTTSWNEAAEKLFEWKREEVIGKITRETLKIIYPDNTREQILQSFTEKGYWQGEVIYHTRSGKPLNMLATASQLKDAEENVTGILVLAKDITERKKTEKLLEEFEHFFNNSHDLCGIANTVGYFEIINTNFSKVLGYSEKEFCETPFIELIHPDDVAVTLHEYEKLKSGELTINFINRYRKKDGSYLYLDWNATPNPLTGKLYCVARDITDRKKAEEALSKLNEELEKRVKERTGEIEKNEKRFRALIENNYDIISLLDRSFKVFYRSPSAVRITGWTDEEIMDSDGTKNIHPDDREKAGNIVKELMANPGKPINCLFRNLHKDGHYLWVEGVVINLLQDEYVKAIVFNFRDITARKEAEEKIIASEKQFRYTLDNMLEGIQIHDFNWRYIYTNDTLIKYSKYSREELLGHTLMEKYPGIEQTGLFKVMQRCMNERVTEHLETEFIFPDGTKTDFELSIQPVPEGIFILSIDISKRKKAEAAILRAEANYREIFDKANDGIYVHEIETGKVINVNHRATELNGFSKEELLTGDPHDFMTDHPDYTFEKALDHIQKAAGGEPQFFEWLGRCKDGSSSWFEMNLKRTNIGGQDRILAFQRDINDRKKVEEKLIKSEKIYKTIASSIPGSVICLLDAEYRYLLIEGDMLEKLGYSKDKLLGNKAEDVLPPEIFAGVQDEFKKVFKGETITSESSMSGYDIISRFIPLKDENNVVYTIMTVAIDVTELKNTQRDIAELNRGLEEKIVIRTAELKKSNEELEAFSYSVSHDLRAPLRGIIGFTAILEEEYGSKLDEEAKRITSVIKNNTLKMGNLIDDLLAFSRMGKKEIMKTRIDASAIVHEITDELIAQNKKENVISWDIHDLPFMYGDINTIRQVWINLISNSIKYSGTKEQPRIEIGAYCKNGQQVFYIKDNGVGFDEQYKNKLFKVFQRLHGSEEFEGTGVGLALVERIVSRHKGKVWAEAKVNEGACFYFSLPAESQET